MRIPRSRMYASKGGRAPKVATYKGRSREEGDLIPGNQAVPERRDDTIIEEAAESCLYLSNLIPIVGESKGMTLGQYRKLNAQLEAFIKLIDDGCKAEHHAIQANERGIR